MESQEKQMNTIKQKLSTDWNKRAVDILREELENMDREQTKTFFESVATLMANQVRELITKSVNSYLEFFRRYRKDTYPLPDEIIEREYDADAAFEENFLVLKLTVDNQNIAFQDRLHDVKKELVKIVEQIVAQSQNLPRPENTIARSEKMHLWDVPLNDDIVLSAVKEIEDILEGNLNAAEKALNVYDDYIFILREKPRVEAFLSDPNHTREEFLDEIKKYENTIKKIRNELPIEIRMNMFLVDCRDLNKKLCAECDELIDRILAKTAEMIYERAQTITKSLEGIREKISTKASSPDVLV
jgi:dynein heavy chain